MAMTSSNLSTVLETNLSIGEPIRGKVRDCYRLDISDEAHMLIVSTDRVSAFDWVLPTPIPGKGEGADSCFKILVRLVIRAISTLFAPSRYHKC